MRPPLIAAVTAAILLGSAGTLGVQTVADSESPTAVAKLDEAIRLLEEVRAELEPTPTPSPSEPSESVSPTPTVSEPESPTPTPSTTVPASDRPSEANTGPRDCPTMRSLSDGQAEAELAAMPAPKVLSCVRITGKFDPKPGWTVRDFEIVSSRGLYGVQSNTLAVVDPADRPVLEYGLIHGHQSACVYAANLVVRFTEVRDCVDLFKLVSGVTLTGNYAHSLYRPTGAHSDVVQIQSGKRILVEGNNFDARVGSGTNVGGEGNAVLQTGSLNGDIQSVWRGNWFDGGGYTIRLGTTGYPTIDYCFRDNRFGTRFTYGPVNGTRGTATSCDSGPRFDSSNVFDSTGQPVS